MKTIRVLVCNTDALLSAGLMTILSQEPDLQVELCMAEDMENLVDAISRFKPAVVVLQQGTWGSTNKILTKIAARKLDVHVITVNNGNNWLESFRHHRHQVGSVSDLLSVIRSP